MRLVLRLIVCVSVLSAAGYVGAGAANACGYADNDHCYGIAKWDGHANHGARVTLNVDCIYSPFGGGQGFITDELWVVRVVPGNPLSWIEAGFIYGNTNDSRYFFWADDRPDYNFSFHPMYSLPDNLHVDWDVSITHEAVDSPNWKVWQNLTLVGVSTDNFSKAANLLETGSETDRDDSRTNATSHHMDWRGAGGNYNSGWADGGDVSYLVDTGVNEAYNVSWGNIFDRVNYDLRKNSC